MRHARRGKEVQASLACVAFVLVCLLLDGHGSPIFGLLIGLYVHIPNECLVGPDALEMLKLGCVQLVWHVAVILLHWLNSQPMLTMSDPSCASG